MSWRPMRRMGSRVAGPLAVSRADDPGSYPAGDYQVFGADDCSGNSVP